MEGPNVLQCPISTTRRSSSRLRPRPKPFAPAALPDSYKDDGMGSRLTRSDKLPEGELKRCSC